jgi:hypothetical protein
MTDSPEPARMPDDPWLGRFALVAFLALVLFALGIVGAVRLMRRHDVPLTTPGAPLPAPEVERGERAVVTLRPFAHEDGAPRLFAEQRRRLEAYGWTDRDGGFAHIPIEEAMQKVAQGERP